MTRKELVNCLALIKTFSPDTEVLKEKKREAIKSLEKDLDQTITTYRIPTRKDVEYWEAPEQAKKDGKLIDCSWMDDESQFFIENVTSFIKDFYKQDVEQNES